MTLIAVIPDRIRRRWDAIALRQLAALATELAEENEKLERRAVWAEDSAWMWEQTAEIERERGTVGLTVDGRVLNLDRNPGATIDDDPEYR